MCAESASYREDILRLRKAIDSLQDIETICFDREILELEKKVRILSFNAEELEKDWNGVRVGRAVDARRKLQMEGAA